MSAILIFDNNSNTSDNTLLTPIRVKNHTALVLSFGGLTVLGKYTIRCLINTLKHDTFLLKLTFTKA